MPGKRDSYQASALWVSQNYITSARLIHRLISRTGLSFNDHVIEIGPGKGHITQALLARCGKVSAIELDGALAARLRRKFAGTENLALYHQDFLHWPLPRCGPYKVFSNIPFSRTTEIMRKLTEAANPPQEAWLVMEKGAAKRFLGKPRESLRSLLLKPSFDMEIAYHFEREDFHPLPGVDAVLLHLVKKAQPDLAAFQLQSYEAFVTSGMHQGIRGLYSLVPKSRLAAALHAAGIPEMRAPGDIRYIQWLCLFRCSKPIACAAQPVYNDGYNKHWR